MGHHSPHSFPVMEKPTRMIPGRSEFSQELRGFRRDVAAELEDHLLEAMDRALARGATPAQARVEALQSFGDFKDLRRALSQTMRSLIGFQKGTPWMVKAAIGAWMGLGVLLVSRICAAPEPSLGSIAICITAGLLCTALGILLLRGGPRALTLVGFGAIAALVACGALWSSQASEALVSSFALQSWMLWIGVMTALFSAALPFIQNALAAPPPQPS